MLRFNRFAPMVATIAMVLAAGTPAYAAGKADRARAAIATAEGKIQAGDAARRRNGSSPTPGRGAS